jgi:acetolactate synthase small subunit
MPPLYATHVCASGADVSLPVTAYFSVHARAEPGVMPRILELFAKRGLVPTLWRSAIAGADRADLAITIAMDGLSCEMTQYIAACLRQIADVENVLTAEGAAVATDRQPG